jgi:hypothetical protein
MLRRLETWSLPLLLPGVRPMSEGGAPAVPLTSIDWSRLAEPQADEYDTDVVLRLVSVVDKRDKREGPAASARRDSIWFDVSPVYAGWPDFEGTSQATSTRQRITQSCRKQSQFWVCGPEARHKPSVLSMRSTPPLILWHSNVRARSHPLLTRMRTRSERCGRQ